MTDLDRLSYFGGGVVANLMGHGGMTPVEQLAIYRGERHQKPFANQDGLEFGLEIEEHLVRRYGQLRGVKVHHSRKFIRHPEFAFIGGHPDGYVCNRPVLLEAKAVSHWYETAGGWGERGSDGVPARYYDQVQLYMAIQAARVARHRADIVWEQTHFVTFFGSDLTYRDFVIDRHADYGDTIISTLVEMWGHLQRGTYPEPKTIGDVRIVFPKSQPKAIAATEEVRHAARLLLETQKAKADNEKQIDELKFLIGSYMADAEMLMSNDMVLCTFKTDARGIRSIRLKEAAITAA